MAASPSGVIPSMPGSRPKKRHTRSFMRPVSSRGIPVTWQATATETLEARSDMTSSSPRSRAASMFFRATSRITGSSLPMAAGVKWWRISERSFVCCGGSIRFSIGVTGCTFVSRCDEVVPFAAEKCFESIEQVQMSSNFERAQGSYSSM